AEHGDCTRQPDPAGARGCGGQHDGGRGHREVRPVMLADAEHVEADLVGKLDLLDQVVQPLLCADGTTGRRVRRRFAACIDAELQPFRPVQWVTSLTAPLRAPQQATTYYSGRAPGAMIEP